MVKSIDKDIIDYISYDHETGLFHWINKSARNTTIGSKCGTTDKRGYTVIRFRGKNYLAHRIAWYMYYGEEPKLCIDHINGIQSDNRIHNLRDVSHRKNCQNSKRNRNGGLVGACKRCNGSYWEAAMWLDGKYSYIGTYETEQEAHEAYVNKLQEVR